MELWGFKGKMRVYDWRCQMLMFILCSPFPQPPHPNESGCWGYGPTRGGSSIYSHGASLQVSETASNKYKIAIVANVIGVDTHGRRYWVRELLKSLRSRESFQRRLPSGLHGESSISAEDSCLYREVLGYSLHRNKTYKSLLLIEKKKMSLKNSMCISF